ncbi:hypothetical protein DQ04_05451020 [Trypanosoma grayi]|uniref:hypothetical protein n=1 Tax=Trypanosoma grayi TaxID=71804 RepID=UPI0004F4696E|nr:hypothetical protein DQ04_05451020 [Trypanosoma grayi]KEG09304.1 hypothetical protein DQ04_05451020 [Trypanosoma grayi]
MEGSSGDGCAQASQKCIVVNCSQSRYHVVRAAAVALRWYVEDEGRDDVPSSFHGIALRTDTQTLVQRLSSRGLAYDHATSPQVLWLDKSVLASRVAALSCRHRINHFPGMHIIARKAVLFKRLMRIRRREGLSPALAVDLGAFPWSFSASTELTLLERFIADQKQQQQQQQQQQAAWEQFFILKPSKGCQGKGIVVTAEPLRTLERTMGDTTDDYLVQIYMTPPLCIERKKFDLRIYVLVTSVVVGRPPRRGFRPSLLGAENSSSSSIKNILEGLHVFVHQEGLVRICAEEYIAPDRTNCERSSVHLTNYAVNKNSVDFTVGQSTMGDKCDGVCEGNKRDFTFLQHYINALPGGDAPCAGSEDNADTTTRWERLLRRIDTCVMLTILSGWEELQREFVGTGASRGSRSDGRNCFELLGFDMMLTEDLEPVLMEVNHSPSLFCDTPFDFETKRRVVMDLFRLLEPHVPSMEECGDVSYAAYQAKARANVGDAVTGFRHISPNRSAAAGGEWSGEEMCVFEEFLRQTRQR